MFVKELVQLANLEAVVTQMLILILEMIALKEVMKLMVVQVMFAMAQVPVMYKNQGMEVVLFVELVQIQILLVNTTLIL